jgi:hypothetical protein
MRDDAADSVCSLSPLAGKDGVRGGANTESQQVRPSPKPSPLIPQRKHCGVDLSGGKEQAELAAVLITSNRNPVTTPFDVNT